MCGWEEDERGRREEGGAPRLRLGPGAPTSLTPARVAGRVFKSKY